MIVVGLTGGMGMGKSTAAAVFRRAGVAVFDADATVHALQGRGGTAVAAVAARFPGVVRDGAVDRDLLRARVVGDAEALRGLESILHPLVRREEGRFLARARRAGRTMVVLDVPLLLETLPERRGRARVDVVLVVSAPASVQRGRVRRRRRMSEAEAEAVLARQMPDAEKRRRADVVVHTGLSRAHATRSLRRLVVRLRRAGKARGPAPGPRQGKPLGWPCLRSGFQRACPLAGSRGGAPGLPSSFRSPVR